jgi:hypothetical protein
MTSSSLRYIIMMIVGNAKSVMSRKSDKTYEGIKRELKRTTTSEYHISLLQFVIPHRFHRSLPSISSSTSLPNPFQTFLKKSNSGEGR